MANIYKVVLPTGKEMNLQSDEPPSEEQLNTLLSQELPKYKMESNVDSPKYNYALDRKFRSAKIGESLKDPASGLVFIKASTTEYVAPDYEAEAIKSSPGGAALRAAGFSAPATLAGVTAGGRAAAITPGGTPAKILTGLVAGGGAAIATQLLQDKAIEKVAPEVNRRLERDLAEQPNAVVVGNVASALPALRPGKIASTLKQEVGQRAISAGLGGSVQLGSELARSPDGLQEGAGTRALLAAAGEAILDKPTSLGRRLMGTPVPKKPTLVTQIDSTPKGMEASNAAANEIALNQPVEQIKTPVMAAVEGLTAPVIAADLPNRKETIPDTLVQSRNVLQKELDEFIGPIDLNAERSAKTFNNAFDIADEAAKRNQVEAIQSAYEKAIGINKDAALSAEETEIAKAFNRGSEPISSLVGKEVVYDGQSGKLSQEADGAYYFVPDKKVRGKARIAVPAPKGAGTPASVSGVFEKNVALLANIRSKKVAAPEAAIASEPTQPVQVRASESPQSTLSKIEATAEAGPTRVAVDDDDAIEAAAAAQAKRKVKGVSQAGRKGSVLIPGENRAALQARFAKVHQQQRYGGPENMFWPKYNKDVDGGGASWGHLLEHVGDLVHRTSYSGTDKDFMGGGPSWSRENAINKARDALRRIKQKPGWVPFGEQVRESTENTWAWAKKEKGETRSLEEWNAAVKAAGERYSQAYEKIDPVTEVQKLGRDAAIDIGRFDFASAEPKLERLIKLLDTPDWEKNYWKPLPSKGGMSDQSAFVNPTLLVDAGSTFIGATLGYQVGDTQEERLRNAAIGAAIGAGGSVGAKALEKALKGSRGVVSNLMAKAPQIVQKLRSEASEGLREYFLENPDVTPVGKEGPSGLATTTHEDIPEYTYSETLANTPFFSQARELFLNMDAAIRSASPRTFGALNKYEQALKKLNHDFRLVSKKFSSTMRSSFKNEDDWKEFQKAAMNGNVEGVNSAAAKTENPQAVMDSYNETRALLDQIYKMEVAAGRDLNYIPNHFPRKIADYKKLLKAMGRQERGVFESAWAAEKRRVGRDLTEFEKAKIVNQTINGVFRTGNKPSFMKGRTIKEVDDFLIDYYEPIDVSLESYVGRAAQDITDRNWFGSLDEADPKIGGSFGDTIAEEISSGRMTPENEETVLRNLQARRKLNRTAATATEKLANSTRMMTSLAFLGDFQAGVAQAADPLMAVQNSGLRSGAKGVLERLSDVPKSAGDKKKSLTLEDLYLALDSDEINQFAQANKGRLARTTEFVLKRTVGSLDRFGKESLLQASWNQFRRAASNPDSSEFKKLKQKYEKIYPEDFNQMVDDLANNRLTDNTRLLLMTEVGGLQPILPSSMPPFYANSPRGRMIYTLKSFWVKQLNRMRTEGLEKINNGIKTGNVGAITEGTAWMGQYLAFMATSGFAIDAFRDYLMGREVKPEEIRLSAVLKIFGVSKYMASDVAKEGPFNAALAWAFPIAEVFRDATLDAQKVAEYTGDLISGDRTDFIEDVAKESEMLQYVPFLGRSAYNLWGKGKSNIEKREYEESRGRPQPGVKESFIRMLNPDYRDDGSE